MAHLLLSGPDPDLVIGNFLADMLKPSEISGLPEGIRKGIALHYAIDRYTDDHPHVAASKLRIRPWARKYAPVVIDVYFDLSLASRWSMFSSLSFNDFQDEVYGILSREEPWLSPDLSNRVSRMVAHRWLESYASWDGLEDVFLRMRSRSSKPDLLMDSLAPLKEHSDTLDGDFDQFWPDLTEHTVPWVGKNPWLLAKGI